MVAIVSSETIDQASYENRVIERSDSACIYQPKHSLSILSLQVSPLVQKSFDRWSEAEHTGCYDLLKKCVEAWRKTQTADQYMIYGKHSPESQSFQWEIIPFRTALHQFFVLGTISFGGIPIPTSLIQKKLQDLRASFQQCFTPTSHELSPVKKDAFCEPEVIQKQTVLAGKNVNVLYDIAPIGFGGERLHFLVVPKEHREKFTDLTKEEYQEAQLLAQKIIAYFSKNRPIQNAYLMHKTGALAGQSVPHWHLHVILTSNKTQDLLGKLTVLRNMLLPKPRMNDEEYSIRITGYRTELESLAEKQPGSISDISNGQTHQDLL